MCTYRIHDLSMNSPGENHITRNDEPNASVANFNPSTRKCIREEMIAVKVHITLGMSWLNTNVGVIKIEVLTLERQNSRRAWEDESMQWEDVRSTHQPDDRHDQASESKYWKSLVRM